MILSLLIVFRNAYFEILIDNGMYIRAPLFSDSCECEKMTSLDRSAALPASTADATTSPPDKPAHRLRN